MRVVFRSKATKGMIGTYAVASELSRQGWIVVPTYGNAPGVDLLASRLDRTVGIQVKTARVPSAGWLLESSKISDKIFYIFVSTGKKTRFWILRGSEVGAHCYKQSINRVKFRLEKTEQPRFENQWSVLNDFEGSVAVL